MVAPTDIGQQYLLRVPEGTGKKELDGHIGFMEKSDEKWKIL